MTNMHYHRTPEYGPTHAQKTPGKKKDIYVGGSVVRGTSCSVWRQYEMVAHRLYHALNRLPLSEQQKVLLGVSTICAICAIPVLSKNRAKPGHGLFDSEKPQEVELAQEEARRKKLNIGDRT